MSFKSLKIGKNALDHGKKPPFLFKCLKKASILLKIYLKSLRIFGVDKKSLIFTENIFKMPRILKKSFSAIATMTSPPLVRSPHTESHFLYLVSFFQFHFSTRNNLCSKKELLLRMREAHFVSGKFLTYYIIQTNQVLL
jgi:hypothetical protein